MWQPIETAPKDGTPILIGWAGGNFYDAVVIVAWRERGGVFRWQSLETDWAAAAEDDDDPPTHWQPRPQPPLPDDQAEIR